MLRLEMTSCILLAFLGFIIVNLSGVDGFQSVRPSFAGTQSSVSSRGSVLSKSSLNVLVDPSYDLAAGSAVMGTLCGVAENFKGRLARIYGALSILLVLFGAFIAFQTTTLRFQFDDDSFSLVKADGSGSIGENVVVGGDNDWKYTSIKNYALWPSSSLPILVYFTEDQTPADSRVDAPEIVKDGITDSQAHYFPAIARTDQLTSLFEKYNCKHI